MNAKISVFVICVQAIIYLLLYNLHDCTFKVKNRIAPTLLEEVSQIVNPNYNLRNKREFKSHNVKTISLGTESLAFLCPKI